MITNPNQQVEPACCSDRPGCCDDKAACCVTPTNTDGAVKDGDPPTPCFCSGSCSGSSEL